MSSDPDILPVKYEDIPASPREAVTQIFECLKIDTIHVDIAVSSLDRDSQRGSVMSRDRLASNKHISKVDRIKVDDILPNLISHRSGEDFRI